MGFYLGLIEPTIELEFGLRDGLLFSILNYLQKNFICK